MTPEDATNLLLAVMYDGELADACDTVTRLRAAKIRRFEGTRYTEGVREEMSAPPKNGFITSDDGETFALGTVIEILLDAWVRYHTVAEEEDDDSLDLDPVNLRLSITSPGYGAKISFNTPYGLFWQVEYEWKSPEQLQYEAENAGKRFALRWDASKLPRIWSSRTIDEHCLYLVAECLRGREWDDAWEEFTPSYDTELEGGVASA